MSPSAEFAEAKTRPFELAIGTEKLHRLALNYAEGEALVILGSPGIGR